MTRPQRIQRRRVKGWRLPEGAVIVSRPTKWGNPFAVLADYMPWLAVSLGYRGDRAGRQQTAVALYRAWLTGALIVHGGSHVDGGVLGYADGSTATTVEHTKGLAAGLAALMDTKHALPLALRTPPPTREEIRHELRGKSLACFCRLDQVCHADVLLEEANR